MYIIFYNDIKIVFKKLMVIVTIIRFNNGSLGIGLSATILNDILGRLTIRLARVLILSL